MCRHVVVKVIELTFLPGQTFFQTKTFYLSELSADEDAYVSAEFFFYFFFIFKVDCVCMKFSKDVFLLYGCSGECK